MLLTADRRPPLPGPTIRDGQLFAKDGFAIRPRKAVTEK
jgi:hypothetical protein